MSIEAMNWALEQPAGSPSAKLVLLVLANRAHPDGKCWPGIDGISNQTELSRRAVINNIHRLIDAGLMCSRIRAGTGEGRKSNVYFLHIGAMCTRCMVHEVHGQCAPDAGQCAPDAPEPKENHQTNRQKGRRATRIPDDFELTDERRAVAEAEKVPAERTFQKFRDHWLAASGQNARKLDWEATWRNWCRREAEFSAKASNVPARGSRKPTYAETLAADMRAKGMLS